MSMFYESDFADLPDDIHEGFQSTDFVYGNYGEYFGLEDICYESIIEILKGTDYSVEAALSIMYTESEMKNFSTEDFHTIEDELPEYGLFFDRENDVWVFDEDDEWL